MRHEMEHKILRIRVVGGVDVCLAATRDRRPRTKRGLVQHTDDAAPHSLGCEPLNFAWRAIHTDRPHSAERGTHVANYFATSQTEFFRSGSACEKAAVVTLPQNPHPAAPSSANGALLYQPRANRGPQGAFLAPWGGMPWVQIEPPPSSANGALLYQPRAKPWVQIEPPPSSANGALLYQPRAKPWVQIEPPPSSANGALLYQPRAKPWV